MPFTLSTRPNRVPTLLRSRSRCVGLHKLPLEKRGLWNKKTLNFKSFQLSLLNLIARTVIRNEVKMWSSQLRLRFQQSQIKPEKCFRGFNGIRTRVLCVSTAVLHQLSYEDPHVAIRPIYWVHRTREKNETYNNCNDHIFTSFVCSQFT